MTPNPLPRATSVQIEDAGMVRDPRPFVDDVDMYRETHRAFWAAKSLSWNSRRAAEEAALAGDRDWYRYQSSEALRHRERARGYVKSLRESWGNV